MDTIGIICEYNPFHNGHLYHITKIKELYPNSLIILVLNGYFTQRGEISILTKKDKTSIALNHNIDIVLELPFIYGTQSSDTFAYKAVELLNYFQVDKIIFGSESNNIELLKSVASIQLNNPEYNTKVKDFLGQGLNYPTALSKSLNIQEDINQPNDLLGISYLKAIQQINPSIEAITIQRTNNYHDTISTDNIISATNIRNKILHNEDINNYVPQNILTKIKKTNYDLLFTLIKYKINTDSQLATYLTVDEGIENRLQKVINQSSNYQELITNIKTKRYTYNKINRMLVHILLSFQKIHAQIPIEYINILGFNGQGQKYLNSIKKDITIPLKPIPNSITYNYELKASIIYDLLTNSKTYQEELKHQPIKKI